MTESQASWQRLSAFSVFFFIIKFIRIYWYGFVPLLLSDSTFQTNKWLLFFLALMLIIIFAFLRYYFFQYRINTNKITIKTGVFIKREREMSRDRIQHMNLEQNVIYQYLKLRRVRFESAGSAKTEFVLPAIGHGAFEDIREFMENEEEVKSQPELDQSKNDVLYRLGLKDLIIHGISSSRIGIVIGGIFTFYDSIKQNLNDWFDTFIDLEAAIENDILINNSVTLILIYILSLLILIFIFSVLFEVMIYYGFHLKFANGIFSKSYGLLNRKDEQIQKNKVQLFVRKQNPVMQLFKRYNGHFKIADSSENKEAKKSFTLIGFKADIGSEIESILFPEWDRSAKRSYSIQKNIIYQRLKWFVLFPILVASLFLAIEDSLWFYSFLPVSVLIVLKAIISYKSWRIVCNDELIRLEHGRIMKSDTIATFYKFQWVSLQQSVYQRRKQLASLKIGHASGSLIIPYLKLSDAEELMNWIIYKIESSQLEWI